MRLTNLDALPFEEGKTYLLLLPRSDAGSAEGDVYSAGGMIIQNGKVRFYDRPWLDFRSSVDYTTLRKQLLRTGAAVPCAAQ